MVVPRAISRAFALGALVLASASLPAQELECIENISTGWDPDTETVWLEILWGHPGASSTTGC